MYNAWDGGWFFLIATDVTAGTDMPMSGKGAAGLGTTQLLSAGSSFGIASVVACGDESMSMTMADFECASTGSG